MSNRTPRFPRPYSYAIFGLMSAIFALPANAGYFPMFASWPQPNGPATPILLTYSYINLLDGSMLAGSTGDPLSEELMTTAFETALADYAAVLPIHFVEVEDGGPLPETGEYDPTSHADIRIGQVPHIDDANAYAYFPQDPTASGLAGDVVFNAERSGMGWSPVLFYAVAQHELGHSLGMGHFVESEAEVLVQPLLQQAPYEGPIIPLAPLMIEALQDVYGEGTGSVSPIPEPHFSVVLLGALVLAGIDVRRHAARRPLPEPQEPTQEIQPNPRNRA